MQSIDVIAEIGQAHDGSVGLLHSLIDAIAATGVDAIKFQMHIADAESCAHDEFRVPFSRVDATRMDYWRRMELSQEQWGEVKAHCESLDCEFLCTPFSIEAVERLELLGVRRYKVGSGDLSNPLLLDAIGSTGKSVIVSSGMSSFEELDTAVERLKKHGVSIAIMQCTSEYPVPAERWGLNVLTEMGVRYGLPYGLSDHSGTIYPALAAAALGAALIEVHATFDRQMFGPDTTSSLTISELASMVQGVRDIRASLNSPVDKSDTEDLARMRRLFGRSLTVRRDMSVGEVIAVEDLECTKPAGLGVSPFVYESVIGRRIVRPLQRGNFVNEEDME